jgi:hypothetical protein
MQQDEQQHHEEPAPLPAPLPPPAPKKRKLPGGAAAGVQKNKGKEATAHKGGKKRRMAIEAVEIPVIVREAGAKGKSREKGRPEAKAKGSESEILPDSEDDGMGFDAGNE